MSAIATSVLLGGIFVFWLQLAWRARPVWTLPELGDEPLDPTDVAWPRLSVVIACRNEEAGLERALTSVLAQDYPALEVVVVDDRSDDATGAILRALGAKHAALTVERVDTLPPGWLGKTNAMQRGAARARGAWLLFTDADVVFAPGALRRAIAWATRESLGHAVAMPRFVSPGLLERAFVSLFGLFLVINFRVSELRRAGSAGYIGVGGFNLVRRDAYDAIGGHTRLRLEVADDVKLGLVLRRSGVRQGCVLGGDQVGVRWQPGFTASMRGLLKNFFAGCEYRWRQVLRSVLGLPIIAAFPALSLVFGHWLLPHAAMRALAVAAVAVPVALHGAAARRLGGGGGYEGVLLPFASLCVAGVALASALVTTARGAIIWRGTRYSLRDLDAACVRESDWPRDPAPDDALPDPVMPLPDIKNFFRVDAGLATGGQPTQEQLGDLAAAGFDVVVNLGLLDPGYCLPDEAGTVAALGMTYHHIPVLFDAPRVAELEAFVAVMDARGDAPTFVHCAANWRVSAFVALYAEVRMGWSAAEADAHARRFWSPNETWTRFIAEARRALERATTR